MVTAVGNRANVGRLEIVHPDRFVTRLNDFIGGKRDVHPVHFGGIEQSANMVPKAKNARSLGRFVTPHTLKNARPIVDNVGHHMDFSIHPCDKFSIHPNLALFITGIHQASSKVY